MSKISDINKSLCVIIKSIFGLLGCVMKNNCFFFKYEKVMVGKYLLIMSEKKVK